VDATNNTASVYYPFTYEAVKKINETLKGASEEERLSLAVDLFRLWIYRNKPAEQERAKEVFGEQLCKEAWDSRVMYTLTANGKEFRVWFGLPKKVSANHVDSFNDGLLFEVRGSPEVVELYLKAIREVNALGDEIRMPNGVRLYIRWEQRFC